MLRRIGAFFPLRVEGDSMRPRLPPGALVVASPLGDRVLRRGTVVVAVRPDSPEMEVVKRIGDGIGLGPDEYFLLGDNPAASTDSRHFGPVRRDAIRAVVHWRYWPLPPRRA
jgi:nickel-type superoxide dismutase maturation protease